MGSTLGADFYLKQTEKTRILLTNALDSICTLYTKELQFFVSQAGIRELRNKDYGLFVECSLSHKVDLKKKKITIQIPLIVNTISRPQLAEV